LFDSSLNWFSEFLVQIKVYFKKNVGNKDSAKESAQNFGCREKRPHILYSQKNELLSYFSTSAEQQMAIATDFHIRILKVKNR
jgi:hypothetical protein